MPNQFTGRAVTAAATASPLDRLRLEIGIAVRAERRRRQLTLRALAESAGVTCSTVHNVEAGRPASLEILERIGRALRLELRVELTSARAGVVRSEDPVHAAMGEIEAVQFANPGFAALGVRTNLDVPFQHYQHAGRADFVAWTTEPARLLHLENRTQFPNTQAALGSFNAKRAYLGGELAARLGVGRWQHETHVIVALWSAEALHALRLRSATWRAACPDSGSFAAWWQADPPATAGRSSELVIWDPLAGGRRDRRRWVGLEHLATIRPRYRDYREALDSLRAAGKA
jgi:transcriptional regulator with XRE-family HTH domain